MQDQPGRNSQERPEPGPGIAEKVWFSTAEAATFLGYRSRTSVVTLIYSGELKARKRGRSYRIPRAELERLAQAPEEVAS